MVNFDVNVLQRLKLELNNQEYYTDDEYKIFLYERKLEPEEYYDNETMQITLLETCIDILETLCNDVDLMRKIQTNDVATIDQAYEWLEKRINTLKNKVQDLKNEEDEEYSCMRPLFYNNRGQRTGNYKYTTKYKR